MPGRGERAKVSENRLVIEQLPAIGLLNTQLDLLTQLLPGNEEADRFAHRVFERSVSAGSHHIFNQRPLFGGQVEFHGIHVVKSWLLKTAFSDIPIHNYYRSRDVKRQEGECGAVSVGAEAIRKTECHSVLPFVCSERQYSFFTRTGRCVREEVTTLANVSLPSQMTFSPAVSSIWLTIAWLDRNPPSHRRRSLT